jgi:hypothetical protein
MTFFRPTSATIVPSFALCGVSAGLLYYTLLCALNGAGNCLQTPWAVQLFLIICLWPWVAAVRLLGTDMIALASVIGFALSFGWIFVIACVIRWGICFGLKKAGT